MTSTPQKKNYSIQFSPKPSSEEIAALGRGISEEGYRRDGLSAVKPFGFFIKDENGNTQAGCSGVDYCGCLAIDQLWVAPDLRGQGIGTRLMHAVENLAKERGGLIMTVSTINPQVVPLYKRLGYTLEWKRRGYLKNVVFYSLKKDLVY